MDRPPQPSRLGADVVTLMSERVEAVERVTEFLAQRHTLRGLDRDYIIGANHAPLTVPDLQALLDALKDQP